MRESSVERLSDRVLKRQSNGRRVFDPQAKRTLVQACLQPGVSVAGLALQHGVNANLLRKWIKRCRREQDELAPATKLACSALPTFVPVVAVDPPLRAASFRVQARLPNGITVDLGETDAEGLSSMLQLLGRLSCSGSKRS
jgi:transposase